MTGFDQKCLHVRCDGDAPLRLTVELDFEGTGQWNRYVEIEASDGYACHVFPPGLSAHWVRLVPDRAATATAQFHYT